MGSFDDHVRLAAQVRSDLNGVGLVGIDGWMGVGKSSLATRLAAELDVTLCDADDFLVRDQGSYIDHIRFEQLQSNLNAQTTLCFVSGVCLRQVLMRAEIVAAKNIYVKRMATWGWADGDELDGPMLDMPDASGHALRAELRAYHSAWSPHQSADYYFHTHF